MQWCLKITKHHRLLPFGRQEPERIEITWRRGHRCRRRRSFTKFHSFAFGVLPPGRPLRKHLGGREEGGVWADDGLKISSGRMLCDLMSLFHCDNSIVSHQQGWRCVENGVKIAAHQQGGPCWCSTSLFVFVSCQQSRARRERERKTSRVSGRAISGWRHNLIFFESISSVECCAAAQLPGVSL